MAVELNHTIVSVRDKRESAAFVSGLLGLAPPTSYGPFLVVDVDNGVSLDSTSHRTPSIRSTTRSLSARASLTRSSLA